MSLITRCPSCTTMFKVVPDQLRISDGWVRCGHCGEVFDAADHLQDESLPAVAAFASSGQQPAPPPVPSTPPVYPSAPPVEPAATAFDAGTPAPLAPAADPEAAETRWTDVPDATALPDATGLSAPDAGRSDAFEEASVPVSIAQPASTWDAPPSPGPADTDATAWQPLGQTGVQGAGSASMPDPMPWETTPDPLVEHDEILGIPLPAVAAAPADDIESTLPLPLAPAGSAKTDAPVDPVDEFMQEAIAGLPSSGLEPLSVDSLQPPPPSIEQELAAWTADRRPASDEFASAPAPLGTRPQDLEFVREAQRKAFWRRPLVRGGLWLAGLLLVLALAAQWAVHDRDRIAAYEPRARPALEWLCSFSGCRIAAFKQIESISIDSSSFSKTRDNLYLLNVVVKNSARVDLAMPSIELTLTDNLDQPLLRRVLTPDELGAPALLAASRDWSAALPVSVAANSIASRVAGYRVLAFYP